MKIRDREALGRQKAKTVAFYSESCIMTAVVAFSIIRSTKKTSCWLSPFTVIVVVSGMQLLRLSSAIRRHHPPQRAVLSQICCFGEHKVLFRYCWTVLSHVMRGRPGCLSSLLEGRLTGSSWHLPKQGKPARLNYSSEFWLLC